MKEIKLILSHPTGNANVRAVAEGLVKKGLLYRFYTSVALFHTSKIYPLTRFSAFKEFQKRVFSTSLKPYIQTRPFKELGRIASQKMGIKKWLQHEHGLFCVDRLYRDLDQYVSKKLKNVDAVYAYEDGAIQSFQNAKTQGLVCLYDLPIGYWRSMRQFLEKERQDRPEWATTLTGFYDSETKVARKDQELSLADAIFVASSFTEKTLKVYPGVLAPIHLIPYGFPEVYKNRRYERFVNRTLRLLFVGGLSQRKGVANILEAAERLGNLVELTIVGQKAVENCVPLNEGLAKHTWIASLSHSEILQLMRSQDILVFPSLFEGYGLVITEAMSQGTPVITTDRTCGADFIIEGENGWLVEAGNTTALVHKLEEILEQPDCLEKVGRAALITAEKSPLSLYGEKMAEEITNIINKAKL